MVIFTMNYMFVINLFFISKVSDLKKSYLNICHELHGFFFFQLNITKKIGVIDRGRKISITHKVFPNKVYPSVTYKSKPHPMYRGKFVTARSNNIDHLLYGFACYITISTCMNPHKCSVKFQRVCVYVCVCCIYVCTIH